MGPSNASSQRWVDPDQKALDDWTRTKRSMDDFEVLKTDAYYPTWKHMFKAQAKEQDVSEPLDPALDLTLIKSDLQIALMEKKSEYLWVLFLKIFQNHIGRICVKDEMTSMNPLTVFKKHHEMQTKSPAQMYESSKLMKTIDNMSLKTYNDTIVEVVTTFFDNIRLFNEFADKDEHMGYVTIRGLLATAMTSDKDLTGSFTACQPIGVRDVKVAALKDYMISEAARYDNRSDLEQSGINSRTDLKSSQHLQEALEHLDDPELVSDIQDIIVNPSTTTWHNTL